MKFASEDLIMEHEAILGGLTLLEKMVGMLEAGLPADRADLDAMVGFLTLFADTCHHGKEEGILFPAMERYGIPRERGPIGQMLAEHDEGRSRIRGMKLALEAGGPGAFDAAGFTVAAKGYIELLRAHIQKENGVLFPLGDRAIPEAEQEGLLEAFERHEKNVIGEGVHDRLHALLGELSAKYA